MASQSKPSTTTKPLHVLHIASGDLWAGAEVMLYTLAKAQSTDPDIHVTVILLNPGMLEQKLLKHNITVHIIDESRYNSIQILPQMNTIITNEKPDVIHTHRIKENILGSITAWRNHIASVRTTHGAPENQPPLYKVAKRLVIFLDWFLARYYQKFIIAVSADLTKKLGYNFPAAKIRAIENGIDIESLVKNRSRTFDKPADKSNYQIGIAGRLVPVKRIDLFIEIAVHLKKKRPDLSIQFNIYGDGPLQESLKNMVQSKQANGYIHFKGHCDNIPKAILSLDALLLTSDHEGLPMILLEAMSLQVPIITHAVGGIPHLLDNGKCGTLIKKQTPETFAKAIITLIEKPDQRQTKLAYERVRQNYTAHQTAKKYKSLYYSLDEVKLL